METATGLKGLVDSFGVKGEHPKLDFHGGEEL
jgi:hypothetical protein